MLCVSPLNHLNMKIIILLASSPRGCRVELIFSQSSNSGEILYDNATYASYLYLAEHWLSQIIQDYTGLYNCYYGCFKLNSNFISIYRLTYKRSQRTSPVCKKKTKQNKTKQNKNSGNCMKY